VDEGQPKRACLRGHLFQHALSVRLESDLLVCWIFGTQNKRTLSILTFVGMEIPQTGVQNNGQVAPKYNFLNLDATTAAI
jgi:hypothetical protein